MDETLVKNIHETIKKFLQQGTVGASKECLKQCVSTRGLTLSVGEFNRQFDQIVSNLNVNGFTVY